MFGAFHGMGKFMDATTAKIAERFGVSNPSSLIGKFTLKSGETIALTAGDIAVMQGLYAAENGKIEWSWEAFFVAIAFRGGAKVAELFPKLTARFKALPENEQKKIIERVAKKKRTSAEIVKERLEWLQEDDALIAQKNTNQAR
jgi:hypothetical protein